MPICFTKSLFIGVILLIGLRPTSSYSQYRNQRNQFILYNVCFNGLAGGIGAWVNKHPNQKWYQAFWKGVYQGALGGYLIHAGKSVTYQIYREENLLYAWPAHLIHAAGTSVVQNAASNRNFWKQWHINFWFFRLDYNVPDRHFQARVFPSGIYGYLMLSGSANLNWSKSLKTGFLYLDYYESYYSGLPTAQKGASQATSIAVGVDETKWPTSKKYELTAHEIVHAMQYESFVFINPLFNQADADWKEKYAWYRSLSRFVYFDLNGLYFLGVYYGLEGGFNNPCYWENWFEKEAEHYSNRMYVNCP